MKDLIDKFKELKLKSCAEHLETVMKRAESENWPYEKTTAHLMGLEIERRRLTRIEQRYKHSKLNERPTIDQFDFHHHVSRQEQKNQLLSLLSMEFVRQKKDVVLIGNPGVGKSFAAKIIAYAATQKGVKTLFTTAMDMINHLISAQADRTLLKKLHAYQTPDLLVVDEIGYLSLGEAGSHLFFQVVSSRHERKSTMITTNRPFADWGKIFDSTTVATAIADRLVCGSEVFIFEGESYRKRKNRKAE